MLWRLSLREGLALGVAILLHAGALCTLGAIQPDVTAPAVHTPSSTNTAPPEVEIDVSASESVTARLTPNTRDAPETRDAENAPNTRDAADARGTADARGARDAADAPQTRDATKSGNANAANATSALDASSMGQGSASRDASREHPTVPRAVADAVAGTEAEVGESTVDAMEPPPSVQRSDGVRAPIELGIGPEGWKRWTNGAKEASASDAPKDVDGTGASDAPKEVRKEGESRDTRTQVESRSRPLFRMPQASRTGGVLEGLEQRDRALGLSPSGRVVSALHRAARDEVAPRVGTASFHVTVSRDGTVEVALGNFSDRGKEWQAVAERAAADLRRSLPRIPASRKGMRVVVDIVAEETYPNGAKPSQSYGPRVEVTPPKLSTVEKARADLADRNPTAGTDGRPLTEIRANVELPGIYLAQRGKVCGYRIGLSVLGPILQGGCDPSNLGAKPQRMIHAHIREETLF